ncbi:hypothetical protein LC593_16145 [Nostoc sp. CHAB 5844]|nr:hypothetical protein [Nostoc sp. CHAB 5844]
MIIKVWEPIGWVLLAYLIALLSEIQEFWSLRDSRDRTLALRIGALTK